MLHPEAFLIHLAFMQIRDSNEQRRAAMAAASPTPSTALRRNVFRWKNTHKTNVTHLRTTEKKKKRYREADVTLLLSFKWLSHSHQL